VSPVHSLYYILHAFVCQRCAPVGFLYLADGAEFSDWGQRELGCFRGSLTPVIGALCPYRCSVAASLHVAALSPATWKRVR